MVAAALLIGGAVTVALLLRGPDVAAVPQVIVTLEPVADSGQDPFAASKSADPVKAISDSAQSVATASAASMTRDETTGTLSTPGTMQNLYAGVPDQSTELYGGSGELAECDVPKLAEFLAANPDKAKAWAEVRGITPERIPDYLASLTPVILLQDTMVTNYGYRDGVATPRQAVLQAGTGVLVDSTGQPVVRCACGNPLTAPAAINLPTAQLQGARWDTFDPAQAVVVKAAPPVADLVLVDAATGQSYTQPVAAGSANTTTASPPASATTSASASADSAAPGADCAFQTQYPGSGLAWVQADVNVGPGDRGEPVAGQSTEPVSTASGSGFSCPEMIAKWRTYEQWTGERGGQLELVDFPDGSYCGVEFVPAAQEGTPADNGAVGYCQNADQVRFVVWRGELGQHLTSGGTEASLSPSSGSAAAATATARRRHARPATVGPVPRAGGGRPPGRPGHPVRQHQVREQRRPPRLRHPAARFPRRIL